MSNLVGTPEENFSRVEAHIILTNEEDIVSDPEYLPGLGKSDRVSLTFTYDCFSRVKAHIILIAQKYSPDVDL